MRYKDSRMKAVTTVEMAVIAPVILMVFFLSVLGIFYFHDKDIISACAYEAAVAGSTKAREKEGVTEGLVTAIFEERIQGKTILFANIRGSAAVEEDRIIVRANASKGWMQVSVVKMAAVTEPENKIRDYRKIGQWVK